MKYTVLADYFDNPVTGDRLPQGADLYIAPVLAASAVQRGLIAPATEAIAEPETPKPRNSRRAAE